VSPPGRQQYSVVVASFLGWTIDAFDFFLLVFMLGDIAGGAGSCWLPSSLSR
jgi:MFS transporter, SHS family, lactate transporter